MVTPAADGSDPCDLTEVSSIAYHAWSVGYVPIYTVNWKQTLPCMREGLLYIS